jgi:hypothetical protein
LSVEITSCTIVGNSAPEGGGLAIRLSDALLTNTIVAFSPVGPAIYCHEGASATLSCCDLYNNAGDDWVGCIADQYGINGNIAEDPMFCDHAGGDYRLWCDSPCAPFTPPNEECDLIGALPVGCGGTPTLEVTWGEIRLRSRWRRSGIVHAV